MQCRNLKYRSLKIPLNVIFGSLGPGLRKTISVTVQTFLDVPNAVLASHYVGLNQEQV